MNTAEPHIGQTLFPLNDCVLVELQQSSKNFSVKEGKYDSRTEGIVVALPMKSMAFFIDSAFNATNSNISDSFSMPNDLLNKRVHFEEFKEGARIKRNGKIYSFIKITDIRGYEIA